MSTKKKCSAADVLEFVGIAVDKGWYKRATGLAIKSACELVFKILDEHEAGDVSDLDLEHALNRYVNLNPTVNANTLRTYKTRIKTAIRDCIARTADPQHWKPGIQQRTRGKSEKARPVQGRKRPPGEANETENEPEEHLRSKPTYSGLQYSFPLRDDWVLRIENVPMDLSDREVARVSAFLKALVPDIDGKNKP